MWMDCRACLVFDSGSRYHINMGFGMVAFLSFLSKQNDTILLVRWRCKKFIHVLGMGQLVVWHGRCSWVNIVGCNKGNKLILDFELKSYDIRCNYLYLNCQWYQMQLLQSELTWSYFSCDRFEQANFLCSFSYLIFCFLFVLYYADLVYIRISFRLLRTDLIHISVGDLCAHVLSFFIRY